MGGWEKIWRRMVGGKWPVEKGMGKQRARVVRGGIEMGKG